MTAARLRVIQDVSQQAQFLWLLSLLPKKVTQHKFESTNELNRSDKPQRQRQAATSSTTRNVNDEPQGHRHAATSTSNRPSTTRRNVIDNPPVTLRAIFFRNGNPTNRTSASIHDRRLTFAPKKSNKHRISFNENFNNSSTHENTEKFAHNAILFKS